MASRSRNGGRESPIRYPAIGRAGGRAEEEARGLVRGSHLRWTLVTRRGEIPCARWGGCVLAQQGCCQNCSGHKVKAADAARRNQTARMAKICTLVLFFKRPQLQPFLFSNLSSRDRRRNLPQRSMPPPNFFRRPEVWSFDMHVLVTGRFVHLPFGLVGDPTTLLMPPRFVRATPSRDARTDLMKTPNVLPGAVRRDCRIAHRRPSLDRTRLRARKVSCD